MPTISLGTVTPVPLSAGVEQTFTVALEAGKQYRIDLPGTGRTAAAVAYAANLKVFAPGAHFFPAAPTTELVVGRLDSSSAEKGILYFTPAASGNFDLGISASTAGSYALSAAPNTLAQNYELAPRDGVTTVFNGTASNDLLALGDFFGYSSRPGIGSPPAPPTVAVNGGAGFDTVVPHRGIEVTDNAHVSVEADGLFIRANYNGLSAYGLSQAPAVTQLNVKLCGVEAVQFYNTTVYTLNAAHANVARLYDAALGRAPEIAGLAFQFGRLDAGESLEQIAHNFLVSPEYSSVLRPASIDAFITSIYQNALGRAPVRGVELLY